MTPPKERAIELVENLFMNGQGRAIRLMLVGDDDRDLGGWGKTTIVDRIEQAIVAAIEEEREACAAVVDSIASGFDRSYEPCCADAVRCIAPEIRAHSNPEPS